jgi:hypothetical protein
MPSQGVEPARRRDDEVTFVHVEGCSMVGSPWSEHQPPEDPFGGFAEAGSLHGGLPGT